MSFPWKLGGKSTCHVSEAFGVESERGKPCEPMPQNKCKVPMRAYSLPMYMCNLDFLDMLTYSLPLYICILDSFVHYWPESDVKSY